MVTVNIDNELYEQVKEFIQKDRIEYPSLQNFVEKAVKDKLRIETINKKELE